MAPDTRAALRAASIDISCVAVGSATMDAAGVTVVSVGDGVAHRYDAVHSAFEIVPQTTIEIAQAPAQIGPQAQAVKAMSGTAKKWSTAAPAVNRRISVGGAILAILLIGEAMLVQMRHLT